MELASMIQCVVPEAFHYFPFYLPIFGSNFLFSIVSSWSEFESNIVYYIVLSSAISHHSRTYTSIQFENQFCFHSFHSSIHTSIHPSIVLYCIVNIFRKKILEIHIYAFPFLLYTYWKEFGCLQNENKNMNQSTFVVYAKWWYQEQNNKNSTCNVCVCLSVQRTSFEFLLACIYLVVVCHF